MPGCLERLLGGAITKQDCRMGGKQTQQATGALRAGLALGGGDRLDGGYDSLFGNSHRFILFAENTVISQILNSPKIRF